MTVRAKHADVIAHTIRQLKLVVRIGGIDRVSCEGMKKKTPHNNVKVTEERAMRISSIAACAIGMLMSAAAFAAKADPNRINDKNQDLIITIGERAMGAEFPPSAVPGYMIARGSMGTLITVNQLLKASQPSSDPRKDLLSPLRSAESIWPDRESSNGTRIADALWSCRDAVALMRMAMEYTLAGDAGGMQALHASQNKKSMECAAALAVVTASAKK